MSESITEFTCHVTRISVELIVLALGLSTTGRPVGGEGEREGRGERRERGRGEGERTTM